MYKIHRTNEYGQVYSSKGLLQFHNEPSDSLMPEFASLERAKKYCEAFVRRYPHVECRILKESPSPEIVESFRDDEYWVLKNKNAGEWRDTNKKGQNLAENMILVGIVIVSVIFGLVSHYLGVYDLPLWLKLVILPVLTVGTCKFIYWLFPRIC
jgi:hypothetical protein